MLKMVGFMNSWSCEDSALPPASRLDAGFVIEASRAPASMTAVGTPVPM